MSDQPSISPRVLYTLREFPLIFSDLLFQEILIQILEFHAINQLDITELVQYVFDAPDVFQIKEQIISNTKIQQCLRKNLQRMDQQGQYSLVSRLQIFMNEQVNQILP